jgi:hypothetical protein
MEARFKLAVILVGLSMLFAYIGLMALLFGILGASERSLLILINLAVFGILIGLSNRKIYKRYNHF